MMASMDPVPSGPQPTDWVELDCLDGKTETLFVKTYSISAFKLQAGSFFVAISDPTEEKVKWREITQQSYNAAMKARCVDCCDDD